MPAARSATAISTRSRVRCAGVAGDDYSAAAAAITTTQEVRQRLIERPLVVLQRVRLGKQPRFAERRQQRVKGPRSERVYNSRVARQPERQKK